MESSAQIVEHLVSYETERLNRESAGPGETAFDRATAGPGKLGVPGQFSGWSKPVSLARLLAMKDSGKTKGPFFTGRYRLYRVTLPRSKRPLYIGMAKSGGVFRRVDAHYHGKGGKRGHSERLHQHLKGIRPDQVKVQVGRINNLALKYKDMKLLHAYELLLQRRELPVIYNRNVWVFDEVMELARESDG